ncbi:MAG: DUF21 domain-containing protein [Planctomycetota bacterium]|nr:MAG: DUF21 domain-containing protein [Planctomycetota bacterium]
MESILLIVNLLFLSAIFSGSETALYSMSKVRVDYLVGIGDQRARILRWLQTPIAPTIITILIANNIIAEMLARTTERSIPMSGLGSVVIATLVLTPLLLIFGEFLPKWLGRTYPDAYMYRMTIIMAISRYILWIPTTFCRIITRILQRITPGQHSEIWEPSSSRPNLRTFIRSPENSVVVSPVQQRLVDRILALERLTLAIDKVSKPLQVVQSLSATLRIDQIIPNLGPKYFQRYLVQSPGAHFADGWVSAQALVTAEPHLRLSDISRPLPRLPDHTPLHVALHRMHVEGAEMVLVVNQHGQPYRVAFRGDCLRALMQI